MDICLITDYKIRGCTLTVWQFRFSLWQSEVVWLWQFGGWILTVWQMWLCLSWQLGVVFWLCDSWGCTLYGSWGLYLDCVTVGVVLIMAARGCVWTEWQGEAVLWFYDYWGTVLWQWARVPLQDNARVGDEFMRQIEPIAANIPYMTCPGNHEME